MVFVSDNLKPTLAQLDIGGESPGLSGRSLVQASERRELCLRLLLACKPVQETHDVDNGCRHEMSQMRFCPSNVA